MTTTPTINIRRATVEDTSLLSVLGAHTFSDAFASFNKPEDMAAYLASAFSPPVLMEELKDSRATFLVAEINAVAVGYAKLHNSAAPMCVAGARPTEIARLYVEHDWHGRGVGEALMRECIEIARREGTRTIWLGVWEHNARALAFYRKWGFHEVGEHIFQLGEDRQTDILMERAI